jgi:hypothetical protein
VADLKRWFKVWTSVLDDPSHSDLALEDVGRWCRLGAMMALVGEGGRLAVTRPATRLCQVLEVATLDDALVAIKRLPNVHVEEGKTVYDAYTVTFKNWSKYQVDRTVGERVKRLRSKRRGEERREEEKRGKGHGVVADAQFLDALKANPAYAGIDIDREMGKLDAWLLTPKGRGKQKTRQRVVNWLNGVDRPMGESRPADPYSKFPGA